MEDPKSSKFVTAKLVFLLVGMISTFILFKVAIIPYIFSTLPSFWMSLRIWLSPPYIYIILNFIIITIAASSSFNTSKPIKDKENPKPTYPKKTEDNPKLDIRLLDMIEEEDDHVSKPHIDPSQQTSSIMKDFSDSDNNVITKTEQPDTIEDTWKLITQGKGKILKPQLKKSDTWDTPPRVVVPPEHGVRELRKSDTFNDKVSLQREKSMGQEELNRRAEAFIKKFNNDIRLQRQQSDQRFKEEMFKYNPKSFV